MSSTKGDYSVVHWGIAGAGKISSDFVSAVLTDPQGRHEFVAVASKCLERARSFANKFEIPKSYGSYSELAIDSNVQVVYIGNLNVEHYETAKLFLEHGKHVLVEKPITMNSRQTESLAKMARDKNLFLMEALWSRFFPSYEFVREQIQNGAIGKPLYASANFGCPISEVERVKSKQSGGGTILDLGIYVLNVLQMAFGNDIPENIVAAGHLNDDGVDTNLSAVLNYSEERTGVVSTHSRVRLENEAYIVGTRGMIKMLPPFHCCEKVIVNGQLYEFLLPSSKHQFNFPNSVGLKFEADHVRQVLMEGKIESETMPHRHSVIISRILDELRLQLNVTFDVDRNA